MIEYPLDNTTTLKAKAEDISYCFCGKTLTIFGSIQH